MKTQTLNYILTATGGVTAPALEIIIHADTDEKADKLARERVGQLSKARYFQFHLFKMGDTDVQIGAYGVAEQEPIITNCMKKAG